MTQTNTFWLSIPLLIALLSSWWLIDYLDQEKTQEEIISQTSKNVFMTNVRFTWTDETGQVQGTLTAPEIMHINEHDQVIFAKPTVKLIAKDGLPWTILAERGQSYGAREIILSGGVKAVQKQPNNEGDISFSTDKITLYPKKQIAVTPNLVTISQPGGFIESTGLHLDMKKGTLKLLSQAKAHYEQSHP